MPNIQVVDLEPAQDSAPAQMLNDAAANVGFEMNRLFQTADSNSAFNAGEADKLRTWQERQNQLAMDFNMSEAEKNRNWQEYMSNTAHQREIADLQAAGLNPILSVTGGNGAAVGSGATAQGVTSAGAHGSADTSANSAITTLLSSLVAAQTNAANAALSAMTQESIADKANAVSQVLAQLNSATSRYVSDNALSSALGSANIYTQNDRWMAEHYPDSMAQLVEGIIERLFGAPASDPAGVADGIVGALEDFGNTGLGMFLKDKATAVGKTVSDAKDAVSDTLNKIKLDAQKRTTSNGRGGKF